MNKDETMNKAKSKWLFVLLMLLFVLPVGAATLLYLTGWRPASSGNHGDLIQPPRPVRERLLQSLDGKAVRFGGEAGKWTLVYFGDSSCPEPCMKSLYYMRQVHTAQDKERDRVQRIFIFSGKTGVDALKTKMASYPGMRVWTGAANELTALKQYFDITPGLTSQPGSIYLIDPMGNLMMRYPPYAEPSGMLKDMTRLLKYSWVG